MRFLRQIFSTTLFCVALYISPIQAQKEKLIYHSIQTDVTGKIIPWYNADPGISYNHIINVVWNFWDTMRTDMNGLPYYMNHQVWRPTRNDERGIGGDQIQMALSAWRLLYEYSGNERIKANMKFMADYYLSRGFSSSKDDWANIPYPYNTLIYSGVYDGDMILGKNFTQPDKAGSLGIELLHLYEMNDRGSFAWVTNKIYLDAAIAIANTLAKHVSEGNENVSPLPFKVNAITGEIGQLRDGSGNGNNIQPSSYTSNWSGTMELFLELIALQQGDINAYQAAFDNILHWMKKYPLQNNKWGPFFEDVPGWSDTQINAMTFARFIMHHPQFFPDWKENVKKIISWVYASFENKSWEKYGVIVVNEQTAYKVPGNSHTLRQAATELEYVALSGDSSYKQNAIRQLNWATYMVDNDGKNRYPYDENWLTDGYGDYVRHFLRAMGAIPELAPFNENHILSTTSVIQQADYFPEMDKFKVSEIKNVDAKKLRLYYRSFNKAGSETIRLTAKPSLVLLDEKPISESASSENGYTWTPMKNGGLLKIRRKDGYSVTIMK